jgi:hypothetical protein
MKSRLTLCLIIALLFSAVIPVAGQTKMRNSKPQPAAVSMEEATVVDVEALPVKVAPSTQPTGRFANLRPQNGLTDAQHAAMKQAAAQHRTAAPSAQALRPASNALVSPDTPALQTNFDGINANCSFVIPSDMALAVGGSWVVQTVNDCFAVYNKAGALQAGFPKDLNSLFGVPPNDFNTGQFVSDPRGFYDAVANRFVIAALWEDLPNSRGYLKVAISKTADPRGLWNIYSRQVGFTGVCPDFPTVGHNRYGDKFVGAVAIGFNLFYCGPSGFGGYYDDQLWFLPKVQLYKALPFTFWYYFGLGVDSVQPANVDGKDDAARAIFALATYNINYGGGQCVNGCSGLVLYAFANIIYQGASAPYPEATVLTLPTSTYSLPPNASQPYTFNTIDTNDVRISGSVAYSQGRMWATVTTDNGAGGPGIFAWELHADLDNNGTGRCTGAFLNACPDLSAASIDREMNYDVSPSGGIYNNAYFGTIHPDGGGNITMVFNYSGYYTYAGTNYLSQRVTLAPQATFHDGGSTLRNGLAAYPYGRWGDYTGTAVDGSSVWFSGMYANASGLWNTGVGKTGYTSATQP